MSLLLNSRNLSRHEQWELLEIATEGVWLWDIQLDEVRVSRRLLETLGYQESKSSKASVLELTHPDDRQRHEMAIEQHLTDRQSYKVEFRLRKSNGDYVWFMSRGLGHFSTDGTPLRLMGILVNVDEEKKAQAALRLSESRFRSFVDHCPAAFFIKDENLRHLYVNATAAALAGTTEDEMLGRSNDEIFPPQIAETFNRVDKEVIRRQTQYHWTGFLKRKDGSERYIHDVKFPVEVSPGVIGTGGFGVDLTELKDSQDTVESIQRLETVGRLAGGVAHDFNNMLGVIIGFAELAMQNIPEDDRATHYLQQIMRAADRSAGITRQLLGFARKQNIQPRQLNLSDETDKLLHILQHLAHATAKLSITSEADVWPAYLDPSQFNQILTNLVANASDALAGEPGTIDVHIENRRIDDSSLNGVEEVSAGDYIAISVHDSGPGIEAEDLARIFEPFFTTKNLSGGTGLGLATVYGIAKQNKGWIEVQNDSGAKFTVYIPRMSAKSSEVATPFPLKSAHQPNGEHIVLIDDEQELLSIIHRTLIGLGYSVTATNDASKLDDLLADEMFAFDLLISDVVMPNHNGIEIVQRMHRSNPDVPALLISGHSEYEKIDHNDFPGPVRFLRKPFKKHEIAEVISALLGENHISS